MTWKNVTLGTASAIIDHPKLEIMKRILPTVVFLLIPWLIAPPLNAAEADWTELKLPSAVGGESTLAKLLGKEGTILVFLSTECPISSGYIPSLNRLTRELDSRGIQVIGLNSNAGQSLKQIQAHAQEFKPEFPVLKDAGATVARQFAAKTCPEVLLLDANRQVVYRGRIDDRYAKRGGSAARVDRADLERAVGQLLAHETIDVVKTEPVGCPIDFPRQPAVPTEKSATAAGSVAPTYSREISRILQQHCQECHRPRGIGPFVLADYDDALRWSADIESFTASRVMPPWKPANGFGEFDHPRSMPQQAIDQIAAWMQAGCPEGNRDDLPPPRVFVEGWKLGREPDAIFEIPEYTLGGDGPDEYRCFVMPTSFDGDRYVSAIEVRPGNDRVVHHVIAFIDVSGKARELDAKHDGPGYVTSAGFPGFVPAGGLGGWAPGNQPRELPTGTARLLPKGADIALQIHYHRSGKPETDRTRIGLYFSQVPVDRAVRNIPVMPLGGPLGDMRIPAGDPNYEVRSALVLPTDMQAIAVTPHMHLLGKDMTLIVRLPDGTVRPIVRIDQWDFNWQESYTLREPLTLPRRTRLELVAHFDNSQGNIHNPHHPPKPVTWGESTDEEMCIAFVEMIPTRPDPTPLRPPTRQQQLKFLLESQRLDTETPVAEKAQVWRRFFQRMNTLERTGGVLPGK